MSPFPLLAFMMSNVGGGRGDGCCSFSTTLCSSAAAAVESLWDIIVHTYCTIPKPANSIMLRIWDFFPCDSRARVGRKLTRLRILPSSSQSKRECTEELNAGKFEYDYVWGSGIQPDNFKLFLSHSRRRLDVCKCQATLRHRLGTGSVRWWNLGICMTYLTMPVASGERRRGSNGANILAESETEVITFRLWTYFLVLKH